jgi:hypothetical protein
MWSPSLQPVPALHFGCSDVDTKGCAAQALLALGYIDAVTRAAIDTAEANAGVQEAIGALRI